MSDQDLKRILLVDDNIAIHKDFRKVLGDSSKNPNSGALEEARAALLGEPLKESKNNQEQNEFLIDSAYQPKNGSWPNFSAIAGS